MPYVPESPLVFSLFSRKDRPEARRTREAVLARNADSRPGPGPETLAEQRAAARRTEEKIDQIESEMIAAGVVARAAGATGVGAQTMPAARASAAAQAPGQAAAEDGTSLLLGDAAGAAAIDVNGPALPSLLEEAAILYSNGQAQPAALVLRQAVDDPGLAGYLPLAWLMLLDLHQCVGDRPGFEKVALEYASRFESSPPGWSEALSQTAASRPGARGAPAVAADPVLRVPAVPDAEAVAQIESAVHSARGRAVEVDFAQLASLDSAPGEALLQLLARAERGPGPLVLHGVERLFAAARASIEPGRRDPSQAGWMLALQALRALGRKQEFEDLSIEYCVTYEVSPPSWEPPGPHVRLAGADSPQAATDAMEAATAAVQAASAAPRPLPAAQSGAFVLAGDVLGRMQAELAALRAHASGRGDIVIDCRGLRRMEFVAAGDLLNEVVTMHTAGRQVLFVEPNYLVYALMLVMGIQDLAEIRRRKV